MKHRALYGLMAEFSDPRDLLAATEMSYAHGYRKMDAFSPFPIEGLSEALGFSHTKLPLIVLIGALCGGLTGYLMQYYLAVVDYPINVGGRPLHSWPAFIPVTFELTILGASLFAVIAMIALNGLPEPYHPVFNVARFDCASRDRFFLCIEAKDPQFDATATREFLTSLHPRSVEEVTP